jgi:oligopeptide/dipeptide ABC transporter ATP-binding protein
MRQRVMLAMALSCHPTFLIADEPTTALDVTIQATILELIRSMIERFAMSLIFITHNLGVVAHTCDTIGVMYASHLVELGNKDEIFAHPLHPYTVGLLNSIPRLHTRTKFLTPIKGLVCNMLEPPSGCKFHPRCEHAMDICTRERPELKEVTPGHFVACHLHT